MAPETRWHNSLASLIYSVLLRTVWLDNHRHTTKLWQKAWRRTCNLFSCSVRTRIHSRPVILNYGHTYPVYSRKFSTLNNPLIELVYQSYSSKGEAITFLDVGANIGDSVLLLDSNCPNMMKGFCCIEGDPEFFGYLQANLRFLDNGIFVSALLSATDGTAKELIRTQGGTSSAQGAKRIQTTTLDAILSNLHLAHFDVIKIDVEGLDGQVIRGAKEFLQSQRPALIFEWHPILCSKTGNSWTDHFQALTDYGYTRFVWFTKFGCFSHFTRSCDSESIDALARLCLQSQVLYDWHYDVIALHNDSPISDVALADLGFARNRKSIY
jgi:FkbM family methyltransferase